MKTTILLAVVLSISTAFAADGEWPAIKRSVPGQPKPAPESVKAAATPQLEKLETRIAALKEKPQLAEFIPDAEIYVKAVRFAIDRDEFFGNPDVLKCLATAEKRIADLEAGKHPLYSQVGTAVVGYRSYVDGSVQPFQISTPKSLDPAKPMPLMIWLHGRADSETDIYFIRSREGGGRGNISLDNAINIQAFGRNCLGFKAAGEVDILECIASAKKRYNIDPDRIVLGGFSMGGGGAWSVGGHFADQFAAVHAGAGYVDVVRFMRVPKDKYPAWYEQKLWGVHDMPDYVRNFFNTTTIGYGGDKDGQKEAAEIMDDAFKAEGHTMTHIIGKNMGHGYTGEALKQITGLLDQAAAKGRDWHAKEVSLQTRTLRYDRMKWVTATLLQKHWEDSRIDAKIVDDTHITITTKNIAGFKITAPWASGEGERDVEVKIDGQPLSSKFSEIQNNGVEYAKTNDKWYFGITIVAPGVAPIKTHGLTGPIDDAFMDSFLVVAPSGTCSSPAVEKWTKFSLDQAKRRWRDVFRGDLPVKKDTEITAEDIAKFNLICFGDENANVIIKKAAAGLPIKHEGNSLVVGAKKFDAATAVPVMIYPNPLNPQKYIVLNSITTFRAEDDGNNSRQNPKLPDWAIIDATVAPDRKAVGKVMDADFFDESWKIKKK